mgnify:CR=1 FL=1
MKTNSHIKSQSEAQSLRFNQIKRYAPDEGRRHITVSARGLLLTESGATAQITNDGSGVRTRSGR